MMLTLYTGMSVPNEDGRRILRATFDPRLDLSLPHYRPNIGQSLGDNGVYNARVIYCLPDAKHWREGQSWDSDWWVSGRCRGYTKGGGHRFGDISDAVNWLLEGEGFEVEDSVITDEVEDDSISLWW